MAPHEPRCPHVAPLPGAYELLTRLVCELLDAHDDTAGVFSSRKSYSYALS
jgi:hypothetical protein